MVAPSVPRLRNRRDVVNAKRGTDLVTTSARNTGTKYPQFRDARQFGRQRRQRANRRHRIRRQRENVMMPLAIIR